MEGDTPYTVRDYTRDATGKVVPQGPARERRYDDEEDLARSQILIKHRSVLTGHTTWILNADWMSDPELYDDILDLFRDDSRKRVMERRTRTAITWAREQYVARLMFEVKDRIGRDRINDFSDPSDNDRDYDVQPELKIDDRDDEGIPTRRWGRVTVRAPQITLATAWTKLWNLPIYHQTDLNLFNNLDKGLNVVDQEDDAYVQGFDWYNALMWRWRLGQRVTWLTKVGAGGGVASRSDDTFDFFEGKNKVYPLMLDNNQGGRFNRAADAGQEFLDPETFLIGREKFNLRRDVSDGFGYGDFMTRFNVRLTEALTGDLVYRFRETTDDFLGDWYARMGNRWVRSDLYNFRLRENNIEGILKYRLARPRITTGLRLFRNLINEGDLYPQELTGSYGVFGGWNNAAQTLGLNSSISVDERQIFHPSDPRSFTDSSLNWRVGGNYRPASGLWWTRTSMSYRQSLDRKLGDSDVDLFTEDDDRFAISGLVGGKIGPKWISEVSADWDSRGSTFRTISLNLQRDLHDALLMMMVSLEQDVYSNDNRKEGGGSFTDQVDFRIALRPKLPGARVTRGVPGISTLEDRAKTLSVEDSSGRRPASFQRY